MNPVNPLVNGCEICNQTYRGPKALLTPYGVGCNDLPVYVRNGEIMSFWKPDADELAALNAGQVVVLNLIKFQPPCSVGVTDSVTVKD